MITQWLIHSLYQCLNSVNYPSLAHWGPPKLVTILETMSYDAFMSSVYWFKFHWNVFLNNLLIITRTPAFWGYPPPPHDYPYHWVILDPKSNKEDKVKVMNLKNSPKFQMFEFRNKHYTRHTFLSYLIRCANMKWIRWVLLKIQSGHDSVHRRTDGQTDGRTDGQTDKVIPVYPPFNFVEAGGIIIWSGNAWAPNRYQAFIWIKDNQVHSLIYTLLGLNERITNKRMCAYGVCVQIW